MNTFVVKYKHMPLDYVVIDILSENFAIVYGDIDNIKRDKNIIQYELPFAVYPMIADSKEKSCITIGGRNVGGLTGKGVIMGIIDSGIKYDHREFAERIMYIWDIATEQVFDSTDINDGRAVGDAVGHGTAVAGIAAGASGVAYGADIIAVAIGKGGSDAIMRGIKFVSDKARELNKPFVINISYGTNFGAHNGQSLLEQYIDAVQENNTALIVTASGNEGDTAHHYKGKGSNTIEFNVGNALRTVTLEMWKNYLYTADIEIISPNSDKTSVLSGSEGSYSYVLQNTNVDINIQTPTPNTTSENIIITLSGNNFVDNGIWQIVINTDESAEYDIWLPVSEGVDENTIFLSPNIYIPRSQFRLHLLKL